MLYAAVRFRLLHALLCTMLYPAACVRLLGALCCCCNLHAAIASACFFYAAACFLFRYALSCAMLSRFKRIRQHAKVVGTLLFFALACYTKLVNAPLTTGLTCAHYSDMLS